MEIRAYHESYLSDAQRILGHAVDFAVMSLEVPPEAFGAALSVSEASRQFAAGNPKYVSGMNGCELARIILSETHTPYTDAEDAMYLDKSPEYWAGWALAFYQWYADRSFMEILSAISLSSIFALYPVYHETDLARFAAHLDSVRKELCPDTRLRIRRIRCSLSQAQLASESGVALRQIQLFEQRQRDINSAAATTVYRLSKALFCRMEDLME